MIYDFIVKLPCWYKITVIVFSLYYALRGVVHEYVAHKNESPYSIWQKIFIVYIQEFLFKIIFTISGFFALAIAYQIFSSLKSLNEISAGTAVLLVFLFVWGVAGISGYLTFLIVSGKFPGLKGSSG